MTDAPWPNPAPSSNTSSIVMAQGRLAPPAGTRRRLRYTYWLHYAEGSAMSPLLMKLIFDRVESGPMPFFVKPFAKAIARQVKQAFIPPQSETSSGLFRGGARAQ